MNILEREVQVQGSVRQGKPMQTRRSGSCGVGGVEDGLILKLALLSWDKTYKRPHSRQKG